MCILLHFGFLQIYKGEDTYEYIDGVRESHSNWMRYRSLFSSSGFCLGDELNKVAHSFPSTQIRRLCSEQRGVQPAGGRVQRHHLVSLLSHHQPWGRAAGVAQQQTSGPFHRRLDPSVV